MTVVIDEISRWADCLPYWEKAALESPAQNSSWLTAFFKLQGRA
jgi:hypothetical protein